MHGGQPNRDSHLFSPLIGPYPKPASLRSKVLPGNRDKPAWLLPWLPADFVARVGRAKRLDTGNDCQALSASDTDGDAFHLT